MNRNAIRCNRMQQLVVEHHAKQIFVVSTVHRCTILKNKNHCILKLLLITIYINQITWHKKKKLDSIIGSCILFPIRNFRKCIVIWSFFSISSIFSIKFVPEDMETKKKSNNYFLYLDNAIKNAIITCYLYILYNIV